MTTSPTRVDYVKFCQSAMDIVKAQRDLAPDIVKAIGDKFWELIGEQVEPSVCPTCDSDADALELERDQLKGEIEDMRLRPFACPVCKGQQKVPNGFYSNIGGDSWSSSSMIPETCRTCGGVGIVWSGPIRPPEEG